MLALDGIRVIDLTRALSGPICTMTLGDMGADVIKIEQPGTGDESRHWGPPFSQGESAYFLNFNRNKRSMTLNLKHEHGQQVLWRLIETADVLIENFRPGLIASLGFGYDAVHARNPRLIYCSISGFGQDGPEATRPAYDIILQGMSGVTSVTGDQDGDPYRSGLPVADVISGMSACQGILAALYAREQTGAGQKVETTLLGATSAALANLGGAYLMNGKIPPRVGNSHPQIAPYDLIHTADGYVNIAAGNDELWRKLCAALSMDHLAHDARFRTNRDRVQNRKELLAEIELRTRAMTTDELLDRLDSTRIPAGPIRNLQQVFESPQARHMGLVVTQRHPVAGEVRTVNNPLRFSETPVEMRLPPPVLGQHTEAILSELGFNVEEIATMRKEHTI